MIKPIVLFYECQHLQTSTIKYLEKYFNIISLPNPDYDTDEILSKTNVIFAPMEYYLGQEKINSCKNLQAIASPTTGLFHIDVDYVLKENINICSLKNEQKYLSTITSTAEHAWGLLLAVTRRIPSAYESVCEGKWIGREFGKKTPRMISEMSLGILGLGRLGSLVAGYGKAFGMTVYYYDPYVGNDLYIMCENLNDLAKSSDIISIHVHLNAETENLIGRKFLQSIRQGSYIINTARGGIVNENALLDALISGHLGGAGLDMLAGEHLPGFKDKLIEHQLIKYAKQHDNLIITPKIGGCTRDAWEKTERYVVDMVIAELEKTFEHEHIA